MPEYSYQKKQSIQENKHMSDNSVGGIFQISKNSVVRQQFITWLGCHFKQFHSNVIMLRLGEDFNTIYSEGSAM